MRIASRVLGVILAVAAVSVGAPRVFADAQIGHAAPALVVTELNGTKFDLSKERGKVIVVNFWATWCPPCRKEMPALDAVYRQYHDHGLEMIGLSADHLRRESEVKDVMKSFSYPAAVLAEAKLNGFGQPSELPVTYLIDASGVVRAKLTPSTEPVTAATLGKLLPPLLPHKSPARGSRTGAQSRSAAPASGS
jgi:cytochrome c biogenesis protein CcmG, thiol:disulfide interchange protein DsbE